MHAGEVGDESLDRVVRPAGQIGAAQIGPFAVRLDKPIGVSAIPGFDQGYASLPEAVVDGSVTVPDVLRRYGRLRSVTQVGGNLLITTDNGNGNDVVLRVHPR